jgi:MATE family multidrug resistance protein
VIEIDDFDDIIVSTELTNTDSKDSNELFGLSENSTTLEQFLVLIKQAVPVVISYFLLIGGGFVNLLFAGHYVDHESGDPSAIFAGVSLANLFANVSCLSIIIGMSTALETLGCQYNGAGKYEEVGIVLQRCIIILAVLVFPLVFVWLYVDRIFALLGVAPNVCNIIYQFIRIRALTIPMDIINESYKKYLTSIGCMKPGMFANITFNASIVLLDLLFVHYLHLPYQCLAWSWVLSLYLSAFVLFGLSLTYPEVKRTLTPFNRRAVTEGWKEFIILGLPGTIMLCSEWWAYEILTIFASLLGTVQVASQTIIVNTAGLMFMIPLGFSIATTSVVGNSLGANRLVLAKKMGKIAIFTTVGIEICIGICMFFFGKQFISLYTNDPQVTLVSEHAVPVLSGFVLIDGLQCVCGGILKGLGKQSIGAITNVIAFYGIGLPMAWLLCFREGLSVNGLLLGIAFGAGTQCFALLVMIFYYEDYIYANSVKTKEGTKEIEMQRGKFQQLKTTEDDDEEDVEVDEETDTQLTEIDMSSIESNR